MKLYHYAPKEVDVLSRGLLSVSMLPLELQKYAKRARSSDPKQIIAWLEQTFPGRSRAISVLTEPVRWRGNDPMLKEWIDSKYLIEIDYEALLKDSLIEAVWCKDGSEKGGANERFYKIDPRKIDFSPLPWHLCSKQKGLFFGAIRHYFLVIKDGIIPVSYLELNKPVFHK